MPHYDHDLSSTYFELTGMYARSLENFSMTPHRHSSIEMMYVENGHCTVSFYNQAGNKTITVTLVEYTFVIINEDVWHDLAVPEGCSCTIKNVELQSVSQPKLQLQKLQPLGQAIDLSIYLRTMLANHQPYIVLTDTIKLLGVLTEIIYLYTQYKWDLPEDKHMLMYLKTSELLLKISDCEANIGISNTSIAYIREAQQYITAHFRENDLTPERVAESIGVSRGYLMTLYKKHLNRTMLDVINSMRIELSCSILLNSEEYVTDIGYSCGFDTRQSFNMNFKRYVGMTPSEYRMRMMNVKAYSYLESAMVFAEDMTDALLEK